MPRARSITVTLRSVQRVSKGDGYRPGRTSFEARCASTSG